MGTAGQNHQKSDKNFGSVLIVTTWNDGQPWFFSINITDYSNSRKAISDHVDDEDKLTHQISASGQIRKIIIVNECGLYKFILSSKVPQEKSFKLDSERAKFNLGRQGNDDR